MKFTKIIALVLAAAMMFCLAACGKPEGNATGKAYDKEVITPGTLVVGLSPDYPPFESLTADGELEGFDIEFANELVKYMGKDDKGIEVKFQQMGFSTIVTALQSGQVDVGISGFTYDEERAKEVSYSVPYYASSQVAVVLEDSDIKTLEDLKGKKIGAGLGTTGEKAAGEIENATVAPQEDYMMLFEIIKNGAIDAIVCDLPVAMNYVKQGGYKMLEEKIVDEDVSVLVNKDKTELLKEVNAAIESFLNSEEAVKIFEKYGFKLVK